MFRYNSYHKVITAFIFIGWAIFHFTKKNPDNLYFENDQIIREGKTENSLNHGTWTWYYEDGQILIQGEFKKGNREGVWRRYDQDGNLVSESIYKNNNLNGELIIYEPENIPKEKHYYQDGKLLKKEITPYFK